MEFATATRASSKPNLIMLSLALGATTYALMQSLVVPAMPEIQRVTGASETSVSWILTAFLLKDGQSLADVAPIF